LEFASLDFLFLLHRGKRKEVRGSENIKINQFVILRKAALAMAVKILLQKGLPEA